MGWRLMRCCGGMGWGVRFKIGISIKQGAGTLFPQVRSRFVTMTSVDHSAKTLQWLSALFCRMKNGLC